MLNQKSIISMVLCLSTISQLHVLAAGPGGVVIVAQDGSGDYDCIQAAINDYSSTEIVVMPGRYTTKPSGVVLSWGAASPVASAVSDPGAAGGTGNTSFRWTSPGNPSAAAA